MAKILILGGTRFMGYFATEYALARGHEVTLFNRGQSNPDISDTFPAMRHIRGDRTNLADLDQLRAGNWDTVIDTSGYVPRLVGETAMRLANSVQRYIFISSISVYNDIPAAGTDEDGALQTLADPTTEDTSGAFYGGLKVLCEQVVNSTLPGRSLIIRPGLMVGPRDPTDRFGYWVRRTAAGGELLAPGKFDFPVQFIDARDLGEWVIRLSETQQTGTYNATGLPLPIAQLLETCQQVTASDSRLTWVDEAFLLAHNVEPWSELPLWLPDADRGHNLVSSQKAITAGLTYRSIVDTVQATRDWLLAHPARLTTLNATREAELLHEWHHIKQP
jgi:2'-hydroxyisoflavone reductase